MPMLSVPQIWVYSLVDCWAQIFLLTGYWVGWSSRTRQLIAISLSYFVLPVSCMSSVETNSSNLFPFSDAWIGSSPNHIIWLRMRQFEERLRIFWFHRDQVVCEWVVIGNLIVWQDVLKSYPGGSTECATEKEWSTRPSVELPVGEKSLGASSFCGSLPPYTASHHLGEGFPKKSSSSFGFCPNEGGEGPAQIFCPLFTNCTYWVNLGMGRDGEISAQFFFWHIGV